MICPVRVYKSTPKVGTDFGKGEEAFVFAYKLLSEDPSIEALHVRESTGEGARETREYRLARTA